MSEYAYEISLHLYLFDELYVYTFSAYIFFYILNFSLSLLFTLDIPLFDMTLDKGERVRSKSQIVGTYNA